MSEASSAAPPRPAVLDLSPRDAARVTVPGALCPVCGTTTLHAHKLPGATPGAKKPAVRCSNCNFTAPAVPTIAGLLGRVAISIAVLVAAFLVAQRGIGGNSASSMRGVMFAIMAGAGAVYGLLTWRWTVKATELRIAGTRARWARDKEEQDFKIEPRALLDAAKTGQPCPVCAKEPLTGPAPNFLWSRGNLRCPRCRLDVPLAFTETGFMAALVVAGLLVLGGAIVARSGLQFAGNEFVYRVLIGFAIAAMGIYTGFIVQASGDELALKELERAKRRFERRKRGLAVKDDEEEPALWFQENLEAVVVAVILALIIRHFVMEAFVIPTGSMAPTLLGDHFTAECSNCHCHFPLAKREGDIQTGERVEARCPLCGMEGEQNTKTYKYPDVQGGNKILVNKFLYKFSPPERWNVIVFKYPSDPLRKNFIKRLVGLPGETLSIDARGDLLVKPPGGAEFFLARKPLHVQEALWMPAYDSMYPDPRMPVWKPEAPADVARWQFDRPASGGETFTAKPGAGETCLHYIKEIRDHYGYNPSGHGAAGHNLVGDVRVRVNVVPDKDCKAIRLSTVENERVLTVELLVGAGDVAILTSQESTPAQEVFRAKCPPLRVGSSNEVSFGYADKRLTLVVNGEVVFEWDDPKHFAQTNSSSVRIAAVGPGGARFDHVRIDRDLVYVPSGSNDPSSRQLPVPEQSYFVMGDNSPNSQDGRVFGFVKEPHLIGRAFLVFWPLWEVKLIR
ncbi:MAG: S26 family signal peptidase [Planctomycetota bacterium]